MLTRTVRTCIVTVTLLAGRPSFAEPEKSRVVVYVTESLPPSVEIETASALGDAIHLESRYGLLKEWARLGNAGPPHLDAPNEGRRRALLAAMLQAARSAGLDAVVFVSAAGGHRPYLQARVVVLETALSAPVVDAVVPVGPHAPAEALRHLFGDSLGRAPAPDEPAAASPPPVATMGSTSAQKPDPASPIVLSADAASPPDEVPIDARAHPTAAAFIETSYGLELGLRDFRYNDRVTNNLRSYSVVGAPLGALQADVAPFAHLGDPVLSRLGILGGYASAFDLGSDVNGVRVSTTWYRFRVGPRFRSSFGTTRPVDVGASITYGGETFDFQDASPALSAQLPDVSYRFVRGSADVRVPIGRFTFRADVAYMDVLSGGPVADRVGGASIGGVDGEIGGSFAITGGLELRASTGYRRFFYAFRPRQGDAYIAGGAVDQFGTAQLAVAVVK